MRPFCLKNDHDDGNLNACKSIGRYFGRILKRTSIIPDLLAFPPTIKNDLLFPNASSIHFNDPPYDLSGFNDMARTAATQKENVTCIETSSSSRHICLIDCKPAVHSYIN
jgi:hypothetical protein